MATTKEIQIPKHGPIEVLYLDRRDLTSSARRFPMKQITIYDFQDLQPIARAKVVVFVDEDDRIYLMKNRHEFGVIAHIN